MVAFGILSMHVSSLWPKVEPLLRPAMERSPREYAAERIYEALVNRDMQLWVAGELEPIATIDLAMVTEVVQAKYSKICRLQLIGGRRLREAWHLFTVIIDWARRVGCTEMQCYPRPGLARLLRKYDFTKIGDTEYGPLYAALIKEANATVH